ncbi:unnamed protein product, partial [Tetraodon nigroviridis]
ESQLGKKRGSDGWRGAGRRPHTARGSPVEVRRIMLSWSLPRGGVLHEKKLGRFPRKDQRETRKVEVAPPKDVLQG